jgi:hypothetical protein
MSATSKVKTETKNRIDQLIEMRQSHRRPSCPQVTIRTLPTIMTAAKNVQTT